MGSVMDNVECPRCKSLKCFEDFYYKTGEEYIHCPDCGYHYSFFYKRDDEGKLIKIDEAKGYDFDNLVSEEIHLKKPYGAYYVDGADGGGVGGTLENKKQYQDFVAEITSLINQPHKIKSATISRFLRGKIVKETLYES